MIQTRIKVLKAIQDHVKEQERAAVYPLSPPTIRQIMIDISNKSTSLISWHIRALVEDGYLVYGHYNQAHMTLKGRFASITEKNGKLTIKDVAHETHDGSEVWNG